VSRRDAPAFDPAPFGAELRAFVRRMGGGQEADDVVQETFLRAVRAAAPARPRAWLYGVALNVLRDRSRSSGRARIDADPERLHAIEERSDGPAESAIARETSSLVLRAVGRLPERQRAALLLRLQRHMDYGEIATALECSVGTARQHFHLAVKSVRDALAEDSDA
jgi:RNA polymerase sigma-70 factor (ECF subfamily)